MSFVTKTVMLFIGTLGVYLGLCLELHAKHSGVDWDTQSRLSSLVGSSLHYRWKDTPVSVRTFICDDSHLVWNLMFAGQVLASFDEVYHETANAPGLIRLNWHDAGTVKSPAPQPVQQKLVQDIHWTVNLAADAMTDIVVSNQLQRAGDVTAGYSPAVDDTQPNHSALAILKIETAKDSVVVANMRTCATS